MAQGVDESFLADLANHFRLPDLDYRTYSSLDLAYIGDAVFELIIRTTVMAKGGTSVNRMHKQTSALVNAGTQSTIIRLIKDELTVEEKAVYRRGRNTKPASPAKNQTLSDYRRATGFEALMGYLYLKGDFCRMMYLIERGLRLLEKEEAGKTDAI